MTFHDDNHIASFEIKKPGVCTPWLSKKKAMSAFDPPMAVLVY
jgi:hypothetical protein